MSMSGRGGTGDGGKRRESMNVGKENEREEEEIRGKPFYRTRVSWNKSNYFCV